MTSRHYTDEELLAYMNADRDDTSVESSAAVWKHVELDACDECLPRLQDLQRIAALLRDPTVHSLTPPSDVPSEAQVVSARDYARRRADEDNAARTTYEELQRVPFEVWPEKVSPSERTGGFVRILIQAARSKYDEAPRQALRLLGLADDIARSLSTQDESAEQRGWIAKTRAEALRMLGKHTVALECLDVAEGLLNELPASGYDLGFVNWVRAGVLFSLSRYAEALLFARKALAIFREHGDSENTAKVRMVEATILCEQGEVEKAHSVFHRLLVFFSRVDDREMVARLSANLAECEVRLGRTDVAYEYVDDAMRMYEELGYVTEKIRVRWILGHALMRAGHYEEALPELREAASAFADLGMDAEEAVVGLDLAELHLLNGNWREAETLSRILADRFAAEGAPIHRSRAFGCLRDAVAQRSEAADLIGLLNYLRSYLAVADVDDEPVPFQPPVR